MLEKNKLPRNIWFSLIKCRPFLKFLQSFIATGDALTLCQFILSLTSQMPILTTALAVWAFIIWAPLVNKNKLTLLISYNHNALTTFHHHAPNSHVPNFNFLEFLINGLSTRSHGESPEHICSACRSHIALERKSPWFNFLILDLVTDNSWIEI